MNKKYTIVLLLFCLLCFSCKHKNKSILSQAEEFVEQSPDSALSILKTIDFPFQLNAEDYANYLLLYTEAKDKAGISIAKDSLIHIPVKYFSEKHNYKKAALACFYCNRFYYQQNNDKEAMQYLLLSKDYAEKSKNNNLLGLIHYDFGILFEDEFNYQLALWNYNQSHNYFVKSGNERNASYLLRSIGNIYLKQKPQQTDSAFYYYNQALQYAEQHQDTSQMISTMKNIGVAYREAGNYSKAKQYLLQCIETDKNKQHMIPVYNILSNIYLSMNLPDSALYYAEQILPEIIRNDNWVALHNYHYLMSEIYSGIHDYKHALEYYKTSNQYLSSIFDNKINQSVLDIQEKYQSERLKNSLQKAEFRQLLLASIAVFVLLIAIFLICFFRYKAKKKEEKMYQIEQNLEIMKEMLANNKANNNLLKNLLMEQLDVAKKIAQISAISSNKDENNLKEAYFKVFSKEINKSRDWNNLYQTINNLHNGFVTKLKEAYPDLLEKEIQFCCLLRAEFKFDEIAVILGYNNALSAHAQKNKLRAKMGFPGMKEFLDYIHTL